MQEVYVDVVAFSCFSSKVKECIFYAESPFLNVACTFEKNIYMGWPELAVFAGS